MVVAHIGVGGVRRRVTLVKGYERDRTEMRPGDTSSWRLVFRLTSVRRARAELHRRARTR
jgi:hypothetical protein